MHNKKNLSEKLKPEQKKQENINENPENEEDDSKTESKYIKI